MHTEHCTHKGCDRHFTKKNKATAQAAIKMHIDRVHTGRIKTPTGPRNGDAHTGIVTLKHHAHNRLSPEQMGGVLDFIRSRRTEFSTKTACFTAALESAGAAGRIQANSTAVDRYFKRADGQPMKPSAAKRRYTKQQKQQHDIRVNFCPNCGCNIHAVATGMAAALV